ncbi:MAG: hypothetical protein GY787_18310 [Alteromonadales bacterium]|nr:hypothetical protein [Alteromonadales bacterium]
MEIYILNGVEVTLDQLQGAARAAGIPLEEFKVLNNVTLKPTEPDQEIQAEEDFQTGVADEDAYVAPEKYPGASELELKLEGLSSDLQSLRGGNKYNQIAAKESEIARARYDLQNIYDASPLDFDEPRTVLRKGEDEVQTKLKEKYPWLVTKTTGIGNALKVQLPDGTVTLDLDDGFMSVNDKQESVDILNKIKNLDKALTGNQKSEINLGTALDQAVADKDMSNVNTLLEGTGYELELIEEELDYGVSREESEPIKATYKSYSLTKDGELLIKTSEIKDLKDKLNKDNSIFDAITDNAYQAQKEFVLEFNKKLEEEKNVIQTDKQTPLKYYQEQFKKDLEKILGDEITASDKGELYTHFQTIKAASLGNKRKGVEGISVDEQVARYKNLSGLSEELRTKLIESGVSLKDITNKGINDLTLEELGNRSSTIAESIIKENGNQKLINLSQRFIAEDEKTFNTEVANRVEETKKVYDSISSTFAKRAQSIINQAPEGTKITIGYIGGKPQLKIENERVLTEKENREVNRAANQMLDLQFSMSTLQSDYAATLNNINLDIEQYYVNKGGVDENTFNTANKEYNIGSLLAKDINDSFASLLLTVPTLLGSDFAIEEQRRLNKKNEYYETMLAYDDGDFLRYALRTTAQQSGNLVLAIGTAGAGSAIGLTTGMTQAAVGSVFGLTSGTQTYRDLTLGKTDIVKEAKIQRDKLESAYREGIIGQYEYTKMMEDVNNTIAMNDLKPNQIIQASVANGLIEGTITGIIGTAPNSIKLLKDFQGVSQIKNIANNVFKSNPTQLYNYIGKPLLTRPLGEIAEETSIYGLQQYLTEYGLLDRELDLSQLDDTAVSAVVVSGVSQSPGIAYGGILTYGKTKKFEKAVNKLQVNNQNLSKLIQNTKDEKGREALLFTMAENLSDMGMEVDMLSVDMLNLGSDKLKRFIAIQFVKQDVLAKAGVTLGMTDVETAERVAAYKETLTDNQKKQFEDELNAVDTQINQVKDQIDKNDNYTVAKKALGNIYTKYDATLDREGDDSKGKERIAKIIQRFRDDQAKSNVEKAKNNPAIADVVENMRVDQYGNAMTTKDGKPDKRYKLASTEQKDQMYAYHGRNQALSTGRGFANKLTIDQVASDILGDTKLTVVGWKNTDQLSNILSKKNFPDVSEDELNNAYSKLADNKTFGLIVGNKIITQRPEEAQADLEKGIIRAGTVILHEISHAIDDGRITTAKGRFNYADNLYKAASTSSNQGLRAAHQHVVDMLDDLYGPRGENFDNSETYRDEYSKYLQETVFAYEDQLQLERDDNALVKAFNELTTDANALNTPKKALNYMLANNAGFRKGKLSKKSQQALKNRKATSIKFSERTLNEDARKYKELDPNLDMANFLDQYKRLGLRALGYSRAKGDIATDEAISFIINEFPSITKNFDPETAEFSTYATTVLRQRGKGFYKQELSRKEGTQRITAASEATRLVAEETAEAGIELEERASREKKTERRLINPLKSKEVSENIKEIEDAVALTETNAVIADFKNISQDFGGKVASVIFNVPETKITDGTKNLTYAKKIIDGIPQDSEAGNIQNIYSDISTLGRDIRLLPDTNVTSEESRVGVEKVPVTRDVQGRSLGLPNKIIKYFYEDTGKRSKGTTSQTRVYKKKTKFTSPTTEVIKQVQKDMGITPAGELNKYDRNIGQLLKGFAKVKGAVTAVAVAKNKVEAMDLKTAKPKKQISADIGAGRSRVQFSEKINKPFFVDPSNTKWDVFDMVDVVGGQMFPGVRDSDAVKSGFLNLFEALSGEQRVKLIENMISNAPVKFSEKTTRILNNPDFATGAKNVNQLLTKYGLKGTYGFKTEDEVDEHMEDIKKYILPLMPKSFFFKTEKPQKTSFFRPSNRVAGKKMDGYYVNKLNELRALPESVFGKPIKGVTDFSVSDYDTAIGKTPAKIKEAIDSGKVAAFNKKWGAVHREMWQRINSTIRKDKASARAIGNFFKIVAQDTKHPHRLGAQFVGYSPNPKGVLTSQGRRLYEWEHAMPATASYLYLLDVALNGSDFDLAYDAIMDNFKLIALDKAVNEKLNKAKLGTTMPLNWRLLENMWYERYFNPLVFKFDKGINSADVLDLEGNTFQSKYNVNADGSPYTKVFKPEAASVLAFDNKADKAMANARNSIKYSDKIKKARVFDFDDTLARSKSMVLVTMPDGSTKRINATEFALDAATLEQEGAEFNFDEFSKVIDGKKGPLFEVAKKIQDARGSEDIFILTARPANSAVSIQKFLSELGLNVPLKNITGLGDGKPEAKANWFVEKYGEGFNDFYFADDALKNVKAVKNIFEVLDVKGRVQQARVKFSEKLDSEFNSMIERNKGVVAEATFSDVVARRRGTKQKRYAFFIPPSADDFRGLTMYTFAGKGKQGNADQEFFDKALIKPYQRGVAAMNIARSKVRNDYRALLNDNRDIRKKLKKKVAGTKFNLDQAIRVYLWTKEGYEIPGLSKRDQAALANHIMSDESLLTFAEAVKLVTRKDQYLEPGSFWDASTILGDLSGVATKVNRAEYLKEFIDNVDIIFSEKNLNKVEAVYGFRVREALENSIFRMKTGTNANKGAGRLVNKWNNWVNNSVGTIMFFNRRSALLQTISTVNFVNWSDNNPIKAGIAFANQPQYWADFKTLWSSPKLVARRRGLESDLQEAEIAKAAKEGGAQGVISYLLKIGFTPTQLADSFAIASGGATFYRNRINTYKKQGMTIEDAEKKAFEDFSSIAEETQQSADPMLISSQQASVLGRLVLAFQNTPMQYTRLIKKAGQDLINRRGNPMTNISKIIYYGFVQNLIFSTLQNAMFALLPGFDDEEEEFKTDKERDKYFEKEQRREDSKIARTLNSMVDTLLRGSGLAGAVASTIKNVVMEYSEQKDKSPIEKENADIIIAALNISPPIGSKVRKINNFLQTEEFERDVIAERGFDVTIDGKFQLSPSYDMVGELSSAVFNLPLDRAIDEVNAITEALDSRNTSWQRLALAMGWRQWDVNARTEEHDLIKTNAKVKRKEEGKVKAKATREANKKIEKENKRLRIRVLNSIPNDVRIKLQEQERKTGFKTPVYKLKQLEEQYINNE